MLIVFYQEHVCYDLRSEIFKNSFIEHFCCKCFYINLRDTIPTRINDQHFFMKIVDISYLKKKNFTLVAFVGLLVQLNDLSC